MQDWEGFLSSNGLTQSGSSNSVSRITGLISTGLSFAGPVGAAASSFLSTAQSVASQFGKGRKEADQIVPIQESYGRILIEVNRQMDAGVLNRTQLVNFQQLVADGYAEFDRFTRDPRFVDGRASIQARNTIRPLVDGRNDGGQIVRNDGGTLGNLQRMIDAQGGGGYYAIDPATGAVVPANGANGDTSTFVPARDIYRTPAEAEAGPADGGNGLLLAGGAALAAKLLGWL